MAENKGEQAAGTDAPDVGKLQATIRELQGAKNHAHALAEKHQTALQQAQKDLTAMQERLESMEARSRTGDLERLTEDDLRPRVKEAEVKIAEMNAKNRVLAKALQEAEAAKKEAEAANWRFSTFIAAHETIQEAGVDGDVDLQPMIEAFSKARDLEELKHMKRGFLAELKAGGGTPAEKSGRYDDGASRASAVGKPKGYVGMTEEQIVEIEKHPDQIDAMTQKWLSEARP